MRSSANGPPGPTRKEKQKRGGRTAEDEREERGILSLPSNLSEAVRAMKRDPLIRETLGEHIFQKYVTHKKEEWDEYKIRVTQWELDQYLVTC